MDSKLWCLARRFVPLHVTKEKLDAYIQEGHIHANDKDHYVQVFEEMAGVHRETNIHGVSDGIGSERTDPEEENRPTTEAELRQELKTRERQMQSFQGQEGVVTDQWRVYKEAIESIEAGSAPLRLCLQASAGTGKSFLLEHCYCGQCSTGTM